MSPVAPTGPGAAHRLGLSLSWGRPVHLGPSSARPLQRDRGQGGGTKQTACKGAGGRPRVGKDRRAQARLFLFPPSSRGWASASGGNLGPASARGLLGLLGASVFTVGTESRWSDCLSGFGEPASGTLWFSPFMGAGPGALTANAYLGGSLYVLRPQWCNSGSLFWSGAEVT